MQLRSYRICFWKSDISASPPVHVSVTQAGRTALRANKRAPLFICKDLGQSELAVCLGSKHMQRNPQCWINTYCDALTACAVQMCTCRYELGLVSVMNERICPGVCLYHQHLLSCCFSPNLDRTFSFRNARGNWVTRLDLLFVGDLQLNPYGTAACG